MKKVKVAIVRTIMTEEIYEITISDGKAKEIESLNGKNDEIADLVSDEYQKAKRLLQSASFTEKTVNDKVTFLKLKFTEVK